MLLRIYSFVYFVATLDSNKVFIAWLWLIGRLFKDIVSIQQLPLQLPRESIQTLDSAVPVPVRSRT